MFAFSRPPVVLVFLVALAGSACAGEGNEHFVVGNPSGATANKGKPDNYLIKKRQYALSYNNSRGTPNWVSWHLAKKWLGSTRRTNPFAPDTSLPAGFLAVRPNDYRGSGFDRGHLCPAADRSVSKEDMDATFLMTNMVPQAPDLNRRTWEKLESYCRDQVRDRGHDLYIVAGAAGRGGIGSDGARTTLRGAKGEIVVPSKCWKVVLIVSAGTADPRKVTATEARVFAVIVPNTQELTPDWRDYAVTVKEVEKLTGYIFFGGLPRDVAQQLEARPPQTRDRATKPGPKVTTRKTTREKGLELATFEKDCIVANHKTKKYHVPGGRYYESGRKSKNAVFFKNAEDAKKAGYTPASR